MKPANTQTTVNSTDMAQYLEPTTGFDYRHPAIMDLARQLDTQGKTDTEMAIEIYYLVRDSFPYNPYVFTAGKQSFSAEFCVQRQQGYCIPKASLMIALCRLHKIPARLGLADVTNHLSTPKLLEILQTNVFSMHGYVEVYLAGKWVKATPAFNQALCEKMHILPLEFNGRDDSVFQQFTPDGQQHMEYLQDWGTFADLPVDFIIDNLTRHYPHLMTDFGNSSQPDNDFGS